MIAALLEDWVVSWLVPWACFIKILPAEAVLSLFWFLRLLPLLLIYQLLLIFELFEYVRRERLQRRLLIDLLGLFNFLWFCSFLYFLHHDVLSEHGDKLVSYSYLPYFFILDGQDQGRQLPVSLITMTQLSMGVLTPAVHFALGVQCKRRTVVFLVFAHLAINEFNFVHEEFLWAFDNSKFTQAPHEDLVFRIDGGREGSCDHFLNLHALQVLDVHGSTVGFLLVVLEPETKLEIQVLAASVDLVVRCQKQRMLVSEADLDDSLGELNPRRLSHLLRWAVAELTIGVLSESVDRTRHGQQSACLRSTLQLQDLVLIIFERPDNPKRRIHLLKLALDLAALPMRVLSPSVQLLISREQQIVVSSRSNFDDFAFDVAKGLYQKWCWRVVELPVVYTQLSVLVRADGKHLLILTQEHCVAASTAEFRNQDVKA